MGALAGTAKVLACTGIGSQAVTGNVVKFGASVPPFELEMNGGLATLTPVGWWPVRQLGPTPGD